MPSSIISSQLAASLIETFLDSNPQGQASFYNFDVADIFAFASDIENNVPAGTMEKGVALRFGRPAENDSINIGMEAVLYDRDPVRGGIRSYSFADDSDFYGRLSPNFNTSYHTSAERIDFNDAINIADDSGVLLALISFETFTEFIGISNDFATLKIEFARNSSNQLTAILSRRNASGIAITSTITGGEGLYLDENDLIPPPY